MSGWFGFRRLSAPSPRGPDCRPSLQALLNVGECSGYRRSAFQNDSIQGCSMSASANRAHQALASLPPLKLFLDNAWVEPRGDELVEVRNPATGEVIAKLRSASLDDVNRAVLS